MKSTAQILMAVLLLGGGTMLASLANQDLPTNLPDEAVKLLFDDVCKKGCSDEELARWKGNLKAETHDLNADGVPEFFLFIDHSDWCGAGSNCDYWIFQKKENGYALILNDKVLRVKDTVSNGYRDLASETPMGFCDRNVQRLDVTPYKFDGWRYMAQPHKTECRPFTPSAEP